MTELTTKFDDEHLVNMYAVGVLDGDGEDYRRMARVCETVNTSLMNAVRMSGHEVKQEFYRHEEDYMPSHSSRDHKDAPQSWDVIRGNLGF